MKIEKHMPNDGNKFGEQSTCNLRANLPKYEICNMPIRVNAHPL